MKEECWELRYRNMTSDQNGGSDRMSSCTLLNLQRRMEMTLVEDNHLWVIAFIVTNWSDDKLVNPKLLLDLPVMPGPAHNGGKVVNRA